MGGAVAAMRGREVARDLEHRRGAGRVVVGPVMDPARIWCKRSEAPGAEVVEVRAHDQDLACQIARPRQSGRPGNSPTTFAVRQPAIPASRLPAVLPAVQYCRKEPLSPAGVSPRARRRAARNAAACWLPVWQVFRPPRESDARYRTSSATRRA